jgi:hypothetical protein
MTKIDGREHYDQNFGRGQSGMSTSDPTWQILRGKYVTKPNGRASKSAQSSFSIHMGQIQYFSPFIFFPINFCDLHEPSPTRQPFILLGRSSTISDFFL